MPRDNEQIIESYNRTILDSLAHKETSKTEKSWDNNVHNIQLGLNGTLNCALGATRMEVLMRYSLCSQRKIDPGEDETTVVTQIKERIARFQD